MSPVSTATREKPGGRSVPNVPYAPFEIPLTPSKEIVVDWQMPSDSERKS